MTVEINEQFCEIPSWLHPDIMRSLHERGIHQLYHAQSEAIARFFRKPTKNLMISIPTAAGKTLIAEVILIHTLLENPGVKGIYIAPQRSIALEIHQKFKKRWGHYFDIVCSIGDFGEGDDTLITKDLIIMTNEKADSIIRMNHTFLKQVAVFVVDEAHILGEHVRGQTLEVLLSRLLYLKKTKNATCRILGLSATIGNIQEFSSWLGADLIYSKWRPTKLVKGVYVLNRPIYHLDLLTDLNDHEVVIPENPFLEYASPLLKLVSLILKQNRQCIVFVNTRREAEEYCRLLHHQIPNWEAVDYHHAGRTINEQRDIIERFESQNLEVLIATSTIAAGINLPASFVVIVGTKRYAGQGKYCEYSVNQFLQMAGRAGRPDYGNAGYCLLLSNSKKEAKYFFQTYCEGEPEPLESRLIGKELSKHILGLIDSMLLNSTKEIKTFFKHTFYAYTHTAEDLESLTKNIIKQILRLRKFYLIQSTEEEITEGSFYTTVFGKLTARLYISPETAAQMKIMLQNLMKFPQVYGMKVSPGAYQIHKAIFYNILAHTSDAYSFYFKPQDLPLIETFLDELPGNVLVGYPRFQEDFNDYQINRAKPIRDLSPEFRRELNAIKSTCVLWLYSNGISVEKIAHLAHIGKGDVYNAVMQADWLIHALYLIAHKVHLFEQSEVFPNIHTDFVDANRSLSFGVPKEWFALIEIPGMGRMHCKGLIDLGYTTVREVAQLNPADFEVSGQYESIKTLKLNAQKLYAKQQEEIERETGEYINFGGLLLPDRLVSSHKVFTVMDE